MKSPVFTRRTILRGAAGGAFMLPLLGSRRSARAALPKRVVFFSTADGATDSGWGTTGTENAPVFSPVLAPLEALKKDVIVVRGLDNKAALAGERFNGHYPGFRCILTGAKILGGGDSGGHGGISVDQYLGSKLAGVTPFKSMALGVGVTYQRYIGATGSGQTLPSDQDPKAVFDKFFSNLAVPPDKLARLRLEQKSILDGVTGDLAALAARLPAADRAKIQAHADKVRALELNVTTNAAPTACGQPIMTAGMDTPTATKNMIDLIVSAMACDQTRVATLQLHSELCHEAFTWVGVTGDQHEMSHGGPTTANATAFRKVSAWYASQLAYLLTALKNVREDAGTLLDNTMVVWVTTLGRSYSHVLTDVPIVIGGGGSMFRTGRLIDAPGRSTSDVLVSALNFMGQSDKTYGDPAFCGGPLDALR